MNGNAIVIRGHHGDVIEISRNDLCLEDNGMPNFRIDVFTYEKILETLTLVRTSSLCMTMASLRELSDTIGGMLKPQGAKKLSVIRKEKDDRDPDKGDDPS